MGRRRAAQFLAEMEQVVPWTQLCALIEPVYPKGGSGEGAAPVPLERMLRIYLLQLWFNLSDPAVEEALYDSAAMPALDRIDPIPVTKGGRHGHISRSQPDQISRFDEG